MDQFFIRGRHLTLDIYYLSQSCFNIPTKSNRNNGNKILLLNQTLKDIENRYRNVGGYDMCNDELEHLCRKSWG